MITKDDIRAHVRPQFEELLELVVERAWAELQERIDQVLDVARSALESDIESRGGGTGETPGRVVVAELEEGTPRDAGSTPAPDTVRAPGRVNTCRKCGAVGFTMKTCGVTHDKNGAITSARRPTARTSDFPSGNAGSNPAERAQVVESPPPIRAERRAAIERAAARMDTGGGSPRGAARPRRTDDQPAEVTFDLPTPTASFSF